MHYRLFENDKQDLFSVDVLYLEEINFSIVLEMWTFAVFCVVNTVSACNLAK